VRPLTLFAHRSPVNTISYWYRPHKSRTRTPVLFLHGIGIGLYPYVSFLAELNKFARHEKDSDIGVIALEILPVSFRITHPVLVKEEMCRQIHAILLRHDFEKVVLVSHSSVFPILTFQINSPVLRLSLDMAQSLQLTCSRIRKYHDTSHL